MDVVFSLTLQYNPPDVSYQVQKITQKLVHIINRIYHHFLVSRGRKSVLLFTSGKRKAEVLMTSVGFGVTKLRTY